MALARLGILLLAGPGLMSAGFPSEQDPLVPVAEEAGTLEEAPTLEKARAWSSTGRPGRSLQILDELQRTSTWSAQHRSLEWTAAAGARDYQRLLASAEAALESGGEEVDPKLAAWNAAFAALWLQRPDAALAACSALDDQLARQIDELGEQEHADWSAAADRFRLDASSQLERRAEIQAAVERGRWTALGLLGSGSLLLLYWLRR